MPKHLSIETVIEKNRIASTTAFVMLIEVGVINEVTGILDETIYLARNNEDITYQGHVYTATAFDFNIEESSENIPEVSVSIQDPTGAVMSRAEQYSGGVGWKVRFKYINTGNLTLEPEIEEMVYVVGATAQTYSMDFTLGARNPLSQRFPRRMQWRDRCSWVYKGDECGYTGGETFCDYTLQGPDGCGVKGNTLRFGGFPGIRPRG